MALVSARPVPGPQMGFTSGADGILPRQTRYEARSASSSREALEVARRECFDLFVVDTRLGDGTGGGLRRRLREGHPDSPVIIYSGALRESGREEGLSAGACDYVAKPGVDGLSEAVRRALGGDGKDS